MRTPSRRASAPASLTVQVLALAVISRLGLAFLAWFSLRVFPRLDTYPAQLPDSFLPDHRMVDGWARWDAAHYVAIAGGGYGGDNPSPHGGVGFFPLFPLLMRGAVEVVGLSPTPEHLAMAGIIIANLCFLGAVPLMARWAATRCGPAVGRDAALLLCVAPLSFFFNAAYSESLFLLLALGAFVAAERGRWAVAGALAGLASGTRLVGLALLPALLLLAVRRRASGRDRILVSALAPVGTLAYFAYTWWRFNSPLAYFNAQATWGGWEEHVRFYAELFAFHPRSALTGDPRHLVILLNLAIGIVCLALLPKVRRTVDPGVALFTALLVVVQFAFTWVSLGRYLLPAFGVYVAAAALLTQPRWSGWPRDVVLVGSTLLLALLTILYGHGFWVV